MVDETSQLFGIIRTFIFLVYPYFSSYNEVKGHISIEESKMKNKKIRKLVVYLMLISMLLTTLFSGIAFML